MSLLALLALTSCSADHSGQTQLTIEVTRTGRGQTSSAVFYLSCHPPRGDVPRPARSCRLVEKYPTLVTDPRPVVCLGRFFNRDDVTISGWLNGQPVRSEFENECWTYSDPLVRAGLFGGFVDQALRK
jgi:hypothetical protein